MNLLDCSEGNSSRGWMTEITAVFLVEGCAWGS